MKWEFFKKKKFSLLLNRKWDLKWELEIGIVDKYDLNVFPLFLEKKNCSIFILEAIEAESHLLYYLQVVAFNSDSN